MCDPPRPPPGVPASGVWKGRGVWLPSLLHSPRLSRCQLVVGLGRAVTTDPKGHSCVLQSLVFLYLPLLGFCPGGQIPAPAELGVPGPSAPGLRSGVSGRFTACAPGCCSQPPRWGGGCASVWGSETTAHPPLPRGLAPWTALTTHKFKERAVENPEAARLGTHPRAGTGVGPGAEEPPAEPL